MNKIKRGIKSETFMSSPPTLTLSMYQTWIFRPTSRPLYYAEFIRCLYEKPFKGIPPLFIRACPLNSGACKNPLGLTRDSICKRIPSPALHNLVLRGMNSAINGMEKKFPFFFLLSFSPERNPMFRGRLLSGSALTVEIKISRISPKETQFIKPHINH